MLEILSTTLGAELTWWAFALLIGAAFIAGYVDAIAGGGGMVQTLALLIAGIHPIATLATNKIVSLSGTLTAVIKYARSHAINWFLVKACLIPCLIASAIGSCVIMFLSTKIVTWLIILCIPVALIITFLPQKKNNQNPKSLQNSDIHAESTDRQKAIACITPIAFYDGLIGPGTGTYMAIVANKWLNMRFLRATGFAKPLNLSTNIGAAVMYITAGKVIWLLALPMAAASVIGAYMGSHSAIKHGDLFIKKIMLIMLIAMFVVNVYKLIT